MNKYEYKVIALQTKTFKKENWEEELNKLGKEGWKLVAVIPMHVELGFAGATPQVRCFLKRKIKS